MPPIRRAPTPPPLRRGFLLLVWVMVAFLLVVAVVRSLGRRPARPAPTTPVARTAPRRAPVPLKRFTRAPAVPVSDQVAAVERLIRLGYPVRCGGTTKPYVALTFDDGPGPLTEATLTLLEQARVPATFFLVGKELAAWPELTGVPRLERRDGAIGDHTWDHVSIVGETHDQLDAEVLRAKLAIAQATGGPVMLFRPPYGAHDAVTDNYLQSIGLLEVLWSVDSTDSLPGTTASQVLAQVSAGLRPGAIVLMHENRSTTLGELPAILDLVRARGFVPVTVPELLAKDPPTLEQLKTGRCP